MADGRGLPMAMLVNRVARAAEADFFDRLAKTRFADLRMRHTAVLEILDAAPTKITALASQLSVTPQAMSELVDDMERAGYVHRVPDPHDRRARVVVLTPRGTEAVRSCYALLASLEAEYGGLVGLERYREARGALEELAEAIESGRAQAG